MNDLYEVLEICLQELDRGVDIETLLFRYPDFADELRPILEGSINARSMAIVGSSAEVVRRNRAKVLQHAAQMREAQARPSRRIWLASLRRLAVTLAVVAALFISGTELVGAASTTLPGDNLYPVKRSWEDVLLLFTFDAQQRQALEVEHENERLHELRELFAEGRAAEVDFAGLVTKQNGNEWVIGGFSVVLSPQTEVRNGSVVVGSAVRVKGHTQGNNTVVAERIELLSPGAVLPDEMEFETENHEGPNQQGEDNSGKGPEGETPKIEETRAPEVESEPRNDESNSGSGSIDSSNDSGENTTDSGGSHESGGDDHSSGDHSEDSGSHSSSEDSGGGGDNSGSGGGGDD